MGNLREVARAVEERSGRKLARGAVVLPLPIYEGEFAARFGVLSGERLAEFEQFMERESFESASPDTTAEFAADFIGDAARQVLARTDAGGKFEPVTHDDGRPVRFDEDFAQTLALELPDGRTIDSLASVVLAVFCVDGDNGPELNHAALQQFAMGLLTWMQNTTTEIVGELSGESLAPRPSSRPAVAPSAESRPTS